jgi:hypothetical protein
MAKRFSRSFKLAPLVEVKVDEKGARVQAGVDGLSASLGLGGLKLEAGPVSQEFGFKQLASAAKMAKSAAGQAAQAAQKLTVKAAGLKPNGKVLLSEHQPPKRASRGRVYRGLIRMKAVKKMRPEPTKARWWEKGKK